MQKQTIQFVRGLVLLPFFTASSPFAMLYQPKVLPQDVAIESTVSLAKERADKIDAYFAKRSMPLEGYGAKMIAEAEKNDIDWRLLPAIAIKESTGGKFACGYNPFGWGSCKIKFKSFDAAIETVAKNLGGNNPTTARYYQGTTTKEKLHHYNGSVVPTYTAEVMEFMKLIEQEEKRVS
ncbi:MAG: hypothetical protein ACYCZ7_00085 [Minisyncoccota bacterium]